MSEKTISPDEKQEKDDGLEKILIFLTRVHDLGKKLYTFDLHGTLIVPKESLAGHICNVFIRVMERYGISLLDDFSYIGEKMLKRVVHILPPEPGYSRTVRRLTHYFLTDLIQEDGRFYKRSQLELEQKRSGIIKSQQQRMQIVNEAVIDNSFHYDLPLGLRQRIAADIHHEITVFSPEWELPEYAKILLGHVASLQPQPQLALLSNGERSHAEEAVRYYLSPWFPPGMVFTPADLQGYSKPAPEAYIGCIVGARCGLVYEKVGTPPFSTSDFSEERWYKARQNAITTAQSIIHKDQSKGDESIDQGLRAFCREAGIPELQPSLNIKYVEVHHIGNSPVHDVVPRMSGNSVGVEERLNKILGVSGFQMNGVEQ